MTLGNKVNQCFKFDGSLDKEKEVLKRAAIKQIKKGLLGFHNGRA